MTRMSSSLQNDIDDLAQRHKLFKQKWLEKQRNISDLLTSALEICQINEHDLQQTSNTNSDPEFEHSFKEFIDKHAPISILTLAQVFAKEDEQIYDLINKFRYQIDTDGKTILPIRSTQTIVNGSSLKSPMKHSIPSWMSLPTRRGSISSRERPSRQLIHLLSQPTAREFERESLNAEMDRLLNQQTAMEKMLARRFQTNDVIQEYCQYTTRDECPLVNPHLRRHSRSSSKSSDDEQQQQQYADDELSKKRKRNNSNDFNEPNKRSSRYYRKSSACGKVHFRRLIKSHTDGALGDCSFLNTCFHMVNRKEFVFRFAKNIFRSI